MTKEIGIIDVYNFQVHIGEDTRQYTIWMDWIDKLLESQEGEEE